MTFHKLERLSPEQAALTSNYLAGMAARAASPVIAMQVLFGRCCVAVFQPSALSWEALGTEVALLTEGILSHPDPSSLNLDPVPIIELYSMFEREHREAPELREMLRRIRAEIEAQSLAIRSTGRVRQIASSLARLGFATRIAAPPKETTRLLDDPELWFGASAAQLLDLADHLLAADFPLDAMNAKILALIALGELRNYRIDVGCKLLRTVIQLGDPCAETQDGIDFLSLQRRRDGRYGFPDRLAESPHGASDSDLALFLPMTLNAVWLFKTEAVCMAAPILATAGRSS